MSDADNNVTIRRPTRGSLDGFNICGPHNTGLDPHLDATTFRGIRIENTPVWMQNVMAKSGLFTDHIVKMAQVITWWYRGDLGTFTYWPDGPLEPPKKLEHPLWNKGVVVQNELMFHRGDPVGRPEDRTIEGLEHRSLFGYDAEDERVVDTFLADLRARGRRVEEPSDPFHDIDFIHALVESYTITPTIDWIERVA